MNKEKLLELFRCPIKRKLAGEKSLFLFAVYYFPQIFTRSPADFHYKMAKLLDDQSFKRVLLLMFRESGKTVYAKMKYIQNIVYKKKRFQVLCCYDKKTARAKLFDIVVQLQTNRLLRQDFGELFYQEKTQDKHKQSTKKTIGEFITTNDVKCMAFSIGESPRGLLYGAPDGEFRPDFWLLDDVDVLKAVENKDVIDKNWEWFTSELLAGVSQDSNILFLGNRVRQDGIIPRIEEKIGVHPEIVRKGFGEFEGEGWQYMNIPVIFDDKIQWPARFVPHKDDADGQEWLYGEGGKQNDLGTIAFSSQMLNVIDKHDKMFDISKIELFIDNPVLAQMNIFMTSDLAISEKKSADETVHIVVGVDNKNNLWILDFFNGKVLPDQSIKELFELHMKYKPMKYGLETVGFQKSMKYAIEDKMREFQHFFMIHELKADQKKYERIMGLQPLVQLGKIHIARRLTKRVKGKENILDQLNNFPYGKHDDIIDALAYILQLAFPRYEGGGNHLTKS